MPECDKCIPLANVLAEIKYIKNKVDGIDVILRGDGEKQGLVSTVASHSEFITELKKKNSQINFDLFRAFITVLISLVLALLMWTANKVSTAIEMEHHVTYGNQAN